MKKLVKPLRKAKKAFVQLYEGEGKTNVGCKSNKKNSDINFGCSDNCKFC